MPKQQTFSIVYSSTAPGASTKIARQFDFIHTLADMCSRYNLKIVRTVDKVALQNPDNLSDPFLLYYGGNTWYENMAFSIQDKRKLAPVHLLQYCPKLTTVSHDTHHNALTCLHYLIQAKRTRIAFYAFDNNAALSRTYIDYFLRFAEMMQLDISEKNVFWNYKHLSDTTALLLDNLHAYDAIVCINAGSAACITREILKRNEARIPEDIYIISMQDKRILEMMTPSVTSFVLDETLIAKQIIHTFRYLQKHPNVQRLQSFVDSPLQPRATTGFFEATGASVGLRLPEGHQSSVESGFEVVDKLVNLFQRCDRVDIGIIYGMMQGKTNMDIAAECYLAPSTLTYRIQKMMATTDAKSRSEFLALLHDYYIQ